MRIIEKHKNDKLMKVLVWISISLLLIFNFLIQYIYVSGYFIFPLLLLAIISIWSLEIFYDFKATNKQQILAYSVAILIEASILVFSDFIFASPYIGLNFEYLGDKNRLISLYDITLVLLIHKLILILIKKIKKNS